MELIKSLLVNYINCFKKCVTLNGYNGRASRFEFWGFLAVSFVISIILELTFMVKESLLILTAIYSVIILLPTTAVTTRRLHDVDQSAWTMVTMPLISLGLLLVVSFLDFFFIFLGVFGLFAALFIVFFPLFKFLYWLWMKGNLHKNSYGQPIRVDAHDDSLASYFGFALLSIYVLIALFTSLSSKLFSD